MSKLYFHDEVTHNKKAATIIIPLLQETLKIDSVLDVGCGIGTWLSVFQEKYNIEVLGLDGDYVDKELITKNISLASFKSIDLSYEFDLNKKFDLAICLEVAEHLPASSSDFLVNSLCRHSDKVLFSAAIPNQGGQNHLNEQWHSFWIEKFKRKGFEVYDLIRPKIWNNLQVDIWYRQNLLIFSKNKIQNAEVGALDLVLPEYWDQKNQEILILKSQLDRIKNGKVGAYFYLKSFIKSLRYLGKKV